MIIRGDKRKRGEGMKLARRILETDILIIGGGTAGCFAAITVAEHSSAKVIIAEKANPAPAPRHGMRGIRKKDSSDFAGRYAGIR